VFITEFPKEEHMKVKVLLLVVSIASLLALFCATGIIVTRGGGPTGTGAIVNRAPDVSGIIIERGGGHEAGAIIIDGPGPRA
jgi:hypothetical protein